MICFAFAKSARRSGCFLRSWARFSWIVYEVEFAGFWEMKRQVHFTSAFDDIWAEVNLFSIKLLTTYLEGCRVYEKPDFDFEGLGENS